MARIIESTDENMTKEIGYQLGVNAKAGEIYCLCGDLGVGKTVFTKGFAEGLGVNEHITSPTFTIVNQYEGGRLPLYHFDVYRIGDPEEMYEIGYEECFFGEGVSLVEWADLIKNLIPKDACWVYIKKDLEKGLDYRRIEVIK